MILNSQTHNAASESAGELSTKFMSFADCNRKGGKASLKTVAVFVDFEKAFDSPPREAIFECLEWIGCSPDILAVIRAIHLDPRA